MSNSQMHLSDAESGSVHRKPSRALPEAWSKVSYCLNSQREAVLNAVKSSTDPSVQDDMIILLESFSGEMNQLIKLLSPPKRMAEDLEDYKYLSDHGCGD